MLYWKTLCQLCQVKMVLIPDTDSIAMDLHADSAANVSMWYIWVDNVAPDQLSQFHMQIWGYILC